MRYFYSVLFFVLLASIFDAGAQKVSRGFGWEFGIGPFYSASEDLVNFFPASTPENNITWEHKHFGTNTSIHFYVKPSPQFQFGFLASSAFFPVIKTDNLLLQLHQYSGLLQGEFFLFNKKFNTIALSGLAGTGGITADLRNNGNQLVKIRNCFVRPGEFISTSIPSNTAGISLKFSRFFTAEPRIKADGTNGAGSVLNLTSEAGILQNWYKDALAVEKTNNLIYYLKVSMGGGIFSFR